MTSPAKTGMIFAVAGGLLLAALAVAHRAHETGASPSPVVEGVTRRAPLPPRLTAPPPPRTPEPPALLEPSLATSAAARVPGRGRLQATIHTTKGAIHCELYERVAPKAVDAFVGLASGWRPYRDAESGEWRTGRFYDGVTFHRVVPGFVIQAGDPTGKGTYTPGFNYPLEIDPSLHHRPGTLAVAHKGGNPDGSWSNGSQFYISLAAVPHLDGDYTIFGQCDDLGVITAIGAVPTELGDKPRDPVRIERVSFQRLGR